MLKPQGFGFGSGYPTAPATCALGAAYEASRCGNGWSGLERRFPIVNTLPLKCPTCGKTTPVMLPHLNDDHKWTREEIADWVECIEQQHEASGTSQQATETATNDPAVVPVGELAELTPVPARL